MCGRYFIDKESEEIQPLVEQMNRSPLADRFIRAGLPLAVSGEIVPGMVAPVIALSKAKEKTVFPMRWGFSMKGIPGKSVPRDLINARSETASKLPNAMADNLMDEISQFVETATDAQVLEEMREIR